MSNTPTNTEAPADTLAKKQRKIPHSLAIIMAVVLLASVLTYLVPAGNYDRAITDSGSSAIIDGTFHYVDNTPVNPLTVLTYVLSALQSAGSIIFVIFCCGGGMGLIQSTGFFHGLANLIGHKVQGKEWVVITIITGFFTALCCCLVQTLVIPLTPLGLMIAAGMGMDAIVGVGMVLIGSTIGNSCGAMCAATTGVAQGLAGLPMYSGMGYRLICCIPFFIVGDFYLCRYAAKIKKDPTKSFVYGLELHNDVDVSGLATLNKRHIPVAIVVAIGLGYQVYGAFNGLSTMPFTARVFLYMGVIGYLLYNGPKINDLCETFIKGASSLTGTALLIGFAYVISEVLTAGNIMDTIVFHLSNVIGSVPVIFQAPVMFLMHCVINLLVTSGSGQAAATMPIFLPVADLVGMSRQLAILAFNFGDGFCNVILPHAAACVGFVAMGNIPFSRWFKFAIKLFAIWLVCGWVMMMIGTVIGYA